MPEEIKIEGELLQVGQAGETFVQKIKGFRFLVFILTLAAVGYYLHLCRQDDKLIQVQGIVLGIVGLAGILIGGKTATDVLGKK